MNKDKWIKQQLALKGIYNYSQQDFDRLKSLFIDNITSLKMDKYTAFDRAFQAVFGRKGN
ncbi:hypothetical protein [Persephonella sp.]|uniref:hypothetical protein n=1 Tax=Persephonella sp. TaxID=2060922 RepID=UPI0026303913|nr:hypothetical protein [Persephonella sp.]